MDRRHGPGPRHHEAAWSGRSARGISTGWTHDGDTVEQLNIGPNTNHFPTASVGDGLLLAPATTR